MLYPEIIYKYRDWDNPLHRSMLLYNELYFASPKDFNDPFDCRITQDFRLLDTPEKINDYIIKIGISSFPDWKRHSINPVNAMNDMQRRLSQNLPKVQAEFDEIMREGHDKTYGIICFSAIWNSILLWSHYAKNHQGICIGFYEKEIKKYVERGGMVIYDSNYPKISPLNDDSIKEMIFTTQYKSLEWQYECEYRVAKLYYRDEPIKEERIFNVPVEAIAEVILGINMNDANKGEVLSICRKKSIPVYQAVKVPYKFNVSCSVVENGL